MKITEGILHKRRAHFLAQQEEHRTLMNHCGGAVQAIDFLLADLAKPEEEKKNETSSGATEPVEGGGS